MKLNRISKNRKISVFSCINGILMLLICAIVIYPLWYCLIYSFNNGLDAMQHRLYWLPRVFTLENYISVFRTKGLLSAYKISTLRAVIGTVTSVFFTAMVAYGFSKKDLVGRKFYSALGIVSLFFSGGLIPFFILIKYLGLYNNFWVYIIPSLFSFWNLIIFNTFFRELPAAVEESAKIDGANDFVIFLRLIIPMSLPVLAVIALFTGVSQWNDYFTAVIFINNERLQPIQTFLYRIVIQNDVPTSVMVRPVHGDRRVTSQSVQYATMMLTTLPIVCVYPFLQKYFVKGLLLGSVKG